MSAPEQYNLGDDAPRERRLPPIREIFRAELGGSSSTGDPQAEQPHSYVSIDGTTSQLLPSRANVEPMSSYRHHYGQRSGESFSSSSSLPFVHNAMGEPSQMSSQPMSVLGGGHSYGVLRASGTSGVLTDAIPPSTLPQGIIRQTSYPNVGEHDDTGKRYKCDICGKRFGMPSHLQIHLRTHTADKPFHCSWPGCNKSFTVKSNLTRHLKTHDVK